MIIEVREKLKPREKGVLRNEVSIISVKKELKVVQKILQLEI